MADNQLQDELDRINLDQLHKVVLQISANCFELKKLCATVLVGVATLITTFLDRKLNAALFVSGGVIAAFFWLLDAQSYYYQEKIRAVMRHTAEDMASRRAARIAIPGVGMPVADKRVNAKWFPRVLHAAFNGSMLFYYLVVALMAVLGVAHSKGLFGGVAP